MTCETCGGTGRIPGKQWQAKNGPFTTGGDVCDDCQPAHHLKQLDEYCRATYGRPFRSLRRDEMQSLQDQWGPFSIGGTQVQKSRFAEWAIGYIDLFLRRATR